jgi:biopolymer transport protein ExbD
MFQSVQKQQTRSGGAVVDIAPLIDIVFILLIFFLVTTTFVRDTGVRVDRPQASHTHALEPTSLRVSIAASGRLYSQGRAVSLQQLREQVGAFAARQSRGSVIVSPDESVPSGRLIEVMDAARLAGAQDVAVATEQRP